MRWVAVGSRGKYGDTAIAGMEHDESKKLSGTWCVLLLFVFALSSLLTLVTSTGFRLLTLSSLRTNTAFSASRLSLWRTRRRALLSPILLRLLEPRRKTYVVLSYYHTPS